MSSTEIIVPIEEQKRQAKEVSKQVADRLKEADQLEKAVADLSEQLDELNTTIGNQERELQGLRALDLRSKELDGKARELQLREEKIERDAELVETKLHLEASEKRVADHQEMVRLIFRNAVVRRLGLMPLAVDTGSTMQYDGNGGQIPQPLGAEVKQESFTSEEEIR